MHLPCIIGVPVRKWTLSFCERCTQRLIVQEATPAHRVALRLGEVRLPQGGVQVPQVKLRGFVGSDLLVTQFKNAVALAVTDDVPATHPRRDLVVRSIVTSQARALHAYALGNTGPAPTARGDNTARPALFVGVTA